MGRSLRLAVFAPHYAEYATRLALALADHGAVLLVLDARNEADECDGTLRTSARARLVVRTFRSIGRLPRLRALLSIAAAILWFRPSLLIVQEEEGALTAWVLRLVAWICPVLLTVHDPAPHSGSDRAYAERSRRHQRATRARANAFHVHGRFCRDQLERALGASTRPILETMHGIILTPAPGERLAPEPGRILMFGRMEAYKGLSVLLDAADELSRNRLPHRLVIAGRGPELARLADRIAAMPDVEVIDRYLGHGDVVAEMQRADIVVTPYVDATQSGVIAAAYGNERPVIASRIGGLVDAVEDGVSGVLVPARDAAALAAAIHRVVTDRALRERLRQGACNAADHAFSWARIAGAMTAFAATEDALRVTPR